MVMVVLLKPSLLFNGELQPDGKVVKEDNLSHTNQMHTIT